jgi:hypothetical protein
LETASKAAKREVYCWLASYVLSAIIARVADQYTLGYLRSRLFEPWDRESRMAQQY